MPLFNLVSITVVSYGGIVINLFLLNYKNYRIVLRVFDLSFMGLKTATMVYKSPNGLALDYLKSMFTDRSAMSTYS